MSQQIQITGGAKVRDLNDVIIGTSGVLSSLAFNVSNGVPKLDVNGKILVSQLPNSVMEYLGTWDASTNTPTLVNGTGNAGDVYLCNVAGTVNFGAGAISFVVSDQVIYSGTIWQKASGSNGTVTSVAASITGDSLGITGSPITTSGTLAFAYAGTNLQYVNGAGNLTTFPTLISSIGLSMPSAFSVSNSPLTANGTIAVAGAGSTAQYIRGDGTLATFPAVGGGGGGISFYLNGGTSQGTISGNTYYQMSPNAIIDTGVDFSRGTDGVIGYFLTDVSSPNQLKIPAGNWNFELYFSASSNGGSPSFYVEVFKYNTGVFTLLGSSVANPEGITNGTAIDLYVTAVAIPTTTLIVSDRIALRITIAASGRTLTLHTQGTHLCEVLTTFPSGISALNGLTIGTQYFATGTSGSDFNIASVLDTHTFNIPTASVSNRGALSSTDWNTFNSKASASGTANQIAYFTGANSLASDSFLWWDASLNRIGIGDFSTITPPAALSMISTIGAWYNRNTANVGNYSEIGLYYDGATYGHLIQSNKVGTTDYSRISFINNGQTSLVLAEDYTVGINTRTPVPNISGVGGQGLDIYGGSVAASLAFHNVATGSTITDGSRLYLTTAKNLILRNLEIADVIITADDGDVVLQAGGFEKLRAISSGNVSITGSLQQSAVTSAILKASSTGQLVAAVAGTDYENPLTFSSPLVRTTNTISIPAATTSVNGYLTSTDWNTFNNKGSGTVTSVTGTAPVVSSGGSTPAISMAAATTSVDGYLTSTNFTTFNNKFTLPSLTAGSVLFSDGSTIAQNNANFFWSTGYNSLGIGTQPAVGYVLHVYAATNANAWALIDNPNVTGATALFLKSNGSFVAGFQYSTSTNITQVFANYGDLKLTGGSGIGMSIANTTGNVSITNQLLVGSNFSNKYNASFGSLFIQSYAVNNAWIGDNVYYDGSNFVRVATGYAGMFYFQGSEGQFRFGATGVAGGSIGNGVVTLKTNLDGSFAVGNLSTASGNYTGAKFLVNSSGNVGIGTDTPTSISTYTTLEIRGATGGGIKIGKTAFSQFNIQHDGTDAYFNNTANGALYMYTNNTPRLTITSGGNVGIGTSSPNNKLEVVVASSNSGVSTSGIAISDGATNRTVLFMGVNTAGYTYIQSNQDNVSSRPLVLNGSGGSVGIGFAGYASTKLAVRAADTSSSNFGLIIEDSATYGLLQVRNDGNINTGTRTLSPYNNTFVATANMYVNTDGSIGRAVASSLRFKENIQDWDGKGLDTILALKPKTFTYKADYYKNPDLIMLGLIAEEVAEVSPYLADYDNDDRSNQVENVRYANIVVPLIKAIQELQEQINELKNK